MGYTDAAGVHKRFIAAQALLLEPTTSREKFELIRTLVKGANPQLDNVLDRCAKELSTFDKFLAGDVVSFSAENLPENTEEEKKRKKALVFFIGSWNTLKKEVARVQKELAAAESAETGGESPPTGGTHWRRIFNFAKGPFGLITIAAVGIVLTAQAVSVKVTIQNQGCDPIVPMVKLPFPLPGLSLPKEPIASGQSAVARIPPLTITIDGTDPGTLKAKALTFSADFPLSGSIDDVVFDGASLLGTETVVRLSDKKEHQLTLVCER